jgi:hypothetical protein
MRTEIGSHGFMEEGRMRQVEMVGALLLWLSWSVLAMPGMPAAAGDETPSIILPDDIEQVLWWLPAETEAVVVSRGQPPIPEFQQPTPQPPSAARKATIEPVAGYGYPKTEYPYEDLVANHCIEPLVYFQGLYPGDERYRLINAHYGRKTATLFVKAVWWENKASRETCDIVVFRDNMAERLLTSLGAFPSVPRRLGNVPVLEIDLNNGVIPQEQPRWLAAPRPNVFVTTTSLELLKSIVERMTHRGATRALPPELPEWRYVDLEAPAWGIRHYQPAIATKDDSSMRKWDSNAKGLVFFGGEEPTPHLVLRYLSSSEDSAARFQHMQRNSLAKFLMREEHITRLAPAKTVERGCVETRTRINVSATQFDRSAEDGLSVEATFHFCMDSLFLPWLGFPVHPQEAILAPTESPFR